MNLRDLQYVVSVAKFKHFGRAAAACYVSQPSLSAQIKKLEDELGVMIFERSKKQVLITPLGEEIVALAKQVLNDAERIKQLAEYHQNPFAGCLRLGVIPTVAPFFLPCLLAALKQQYPLLQLHITEAQTHQLCDLLAAGELDVLLLALPLPHMQFVEHAIIDEPFYLAVHKQHALAKQTAVTEADLKQETILLLEDGHCLRDQALAICSWVGDNEKTNLRATSLETLRQMVAVDQGVTFIPRLAVDDNPNIVYIPFADKAPVRTIGLAWRKQSPQQQVIQSLAEMIQPLYG